MELNTQQQIESKIYTIRGIQVMLDSDLADMYRVETRALNQAVKRNPDRFPNDFMFQLTESEWENLKSQIATTNLASQNLILNEDNLKSQNVTSSYHGGRRKIPFVFTEQGVAGLSGVLKSDIAANVHVAIMRAFVNMRKLIQQNALMFQRLDSMELKQLETDQKIEHIFKALESKNPELDKGVFFEGQIFDAYVFIANLIKKAQTNIILIDNYVDETVLTTLAKRKKGVSATICTKQISKQLQLDLQKHNAQYQTIDIKVFAQSHDRFLILDHKELYHLGASLKDLGKKWFAFSRMDSLVNEILERIK